jgi:hypothetical protein
MQDTGVCNWVDVWCDVVSFGCKWYDQQMNKWDYRLSRINLSRGTAYFFISRERREGPRSKRYERMICTSRVHSIVVHLDICYGYGSETVVPK